MMNLGVGPGKEVGARGKRRGFSPGAVARHSQSAREYTENFPKHFFFFVQDVSRPDIAPGCAPGHYILIKELLLPQVDGAHEGVNLK